ncbi:MAG: tRNA (adenosine(37)-N6)-dimethylallyltransferase MiaA [Paracoccaceae bacterium]
MVDLAAIDPAKPVLIAGPTASGKSALAVQIARAHGRSVINADALQVWSCWTHLSARPQPEEMQGVAHHLFGHRQPGEEYSVGHWLREVTALLPSAASAAPAPVIVGGTGLYLTALTEGLADIPPTPAKVRAEADALLSAQGSAALLADLDAATRARIDLANPARVQRAWEVQRATGRGLADWQGQTGPALLPAGSAHLLRLDCDREWLAARIDRRFDMMMAAGALEEVRAMLPRWAPRALWAKAIGAAELVAHLRGELPLEDAILAAKAQSRQYAKRQRTWLRKRMGSWQSLPRP